jgi:hypothetical protein
VVGKENRLGSLFPILFIEGRVDTKKLYSFLKVSEIFSQNFGDFVEILFSRTYFFAKIFARSCQKNLMSSKYFTKIAPFYMQASNFRENVKKLCENKNFSFNPN